MPFQSLSEEVVDESASIKTLTLYSAVTVYPLCLGMQPKLQSIQDWSNRNLFTSSLDYWNQEPGQEEHISVQNTNYGILV